MANIDCLRYQEPTSTHRNMGNGRIFWRSNILKSLVRGLTDIVVLGALCATARAELLWPLGAEVEERTRQVVLDAHNQWRVDGTFRGTSAEMSLSDLNGAEQRRLTGLLHSLGYLDAKVEIGERDREADEGHAEDVIFRATPGPRYRVGAIEIIGIPEVVKDRLQVSSIFGLAVRPLGGFAEEDTLEALDHMIVQRIRAQSYAYSKVVSVEMLSTSAVRVATRRIELDIGPTVRFSRLIVQGPARYSPAVIARAAKFQAGLPFRPEQLTRIRDALANHEFLTNISVQLAAQPGPDGTSDVMLRAKDRSPLWRDLLPDAWPGLVLSLMSLVLLAARQVMLVLSARRLAVGYIDAAVVLALALAGVLSLHHFAYLAALH